MNHLEPPPNLRSLEKRIYNLAATSSRPVRRIQRVIANTVVGQMLPPGVVKGGTALKLRVGETGSRSTPDLDAARSAGMGLSDYLDQLDERLAEGWGGFTGTVTVVAPPEPEGVPDDYVMHPFEIALAYAQRHWLTVPFELGHDEIGSTLNPETRLADDITALFRRLGLPSPAPLPVLAVEHQIAQKLHACTTVNPRTGGNTRAHDLVDLQLLVHEETIDLEAVGKTAARLFAARRSQPWPPEVVAFDGWDALYAEAAEALDVLDDVTDAVVWANDLIRRTKGEDRPGRRSPHLRTS